MVRAGAPSTSLSSQPRHGSRGWPACAGHDTVRTIAAPIRALVSPPTLSQQDTTDLDCTRVVVLARMRSGRRVARIRIAGPPGGGPVVFVTAARRLGAGAVSRGWRGRRSTNGAGRAFVPGGGEMRRGR